LLMRTKKEKSEIRIGANNFHLIGTTESMSQGLANNNKSERI